MGPYELVASARQVLVDWDGCLVESEKLKPGARAFLQAFGEKTVIVSNNSTSTARQFASFLRRQKAPIPEGRIVLAGQATLELAAERYGLRPVYILGTPYMRMVGRRLGLNHDPCAAVAVLLLRDTQFSYGKLDLAANLLRRGAALIVANPDRTHPRDDEIVPETGSLLAAIGACVDLSRVQTTTVGKPAPTLFQRGLAVDGVAPGEAVMIGDNLLTDIEGARTLGLTTIHLDGQALTMETLLGEAPGALRTAG
jgi:HAD superfamily hydrolase (TIGR01450 family)